MYRILCDGFPLLDFRDDDLKVFSPKVKVEVNTVGEGSFKIYNNHPHFDKLKMLKSIFEVSDEYGVIFRGRMTEDSTDFNNGKSVDLEGAMAFFNDSVVRPYDFPNDFLDDPGYIAAAESGNVIEFFLGWLINQHNAQVDEHQRFKLGNVTVTDKNNYLARSDTGYAKTWDVLKSKLFGTDIGGNLCIRYEADGNYIDYLAAFTETNTQGVEYGENLLDIVSDQDAKATYTACIPIGAKTAEGDMNAVLTIEKHFEDGVVGDDVIKEGDMIYCKSAREKYGLIIAPISETTWEDVTVPANLLNKGFSYLMNTAVPISESVEITAADLHFTDSEIRSFRIYKKIPVHSAPHGVNNSFDLTKLDIDILNPQNTKITVGETKKTLTDYNGKLDASIKKLVTSEELQKLQFETDAKIDKTAEEIRVEVSGSYVGNETMEDIVAELAVMIYSDVEDGIISMINASADVIRLQSNRLEIISDYFVLTEDGKITAEEAYIEGTIYATAGEIGGCSIVDGVLEIPAANIKGKLTAEQINVGNVISAGNIATSDEIPTNTSDLTNDSGYQTKTGVISLIDGRITADYIEALEITVKAAQIDGTLTADQINADGMIAENVQISGEINATSGNIGGLTIGDYQIYLEEGGLTFTNDGLIVAKNLEISNSFASNLIYSNQIAGNTTGKTGLFFDVEADIENLTEATGTITATLSTIPKLIEVFASAPVPSATEVRVRYTAAGGLGIKSVTLTIAKGGTYASVTPSFVPESTNSLRSVSPETFTYYESDSFTDVGIQCKGYFAPWDDNFYTLGTSGLKWNVIYAATSTINTSDRNEKNTIAPISDIYGEVFDRLIPVTYKLNKNESDRLHLGLIAQDVKQALDDVGIDSKDFAAYCEWENDGVIGCGIRYEELVPLNIYEIQKLKARVAQLEEKIAKEQTT